MPPKTRTREEIEAVKEKILRHALDLITEKGWEGFSMHKLAERLGIKAVTIYSYYENKDHLYIAIRTRGFQLIFQECHKAYESEQEPMRRLEAMSRAYLNFGLSQPNIYDLMFTWRVPMYRDYIGTPMEDAARFEYEESQKLYFLVIQATRELAETVAPISDEAVREQVIYFGGALHGYIARINNNLLSYMHDDPADLKESILKTMFRHIKADLLQDRSTSGE